MISVTDFKAWTFLMAIAFNTVPITDTLMCYQCGDSQSNGDCVADIKGMEEAFVKFNLTGSNMTTSDILQTKYLKNCDGLDGHGSWGFGNFCIIQEVRYLDKTVEYVRDCSDGERFPVQGLPYFPLKANEIPADNKTRRGALNTSISMSIYITKCSENLCNGPQVEIQDTSHVTPVSTSNNLYQRSNIKNVIFITIIFILLH